MKRFHHPRTTSTNDAARQLAAANPGAALLVSADEQTDGRGRDGRAWHSPPGGAWFSVVLPVAAPRPSAPLTVGLAVRRIISTLAGNEQEVTIKWPNDVLLCGRKVAGVLCEQVLATTKRRDLSRPTVTLILGVGINVNNRVETLADLRHPAASLIEALGHRLDVEQLIQHTARAIADDIARPFVADDVRPHLAWVGRPVRVTLHDRERHGTLVGIDDHGRLRLGTDTDTLTIDAGDVSAVRQVPS